MKVGKEKEVRRDSISEMEVGVLIITNKKSKNQKSLVRFACENRRLG
jgi:hypothetical protein